MQCKSTILLVVHTIYVSSLFSSSPFSLSIYLGRTIVIVAVTIVIIAGITMDFF